jgi:hypothetical protein
MIFLLTNRFCFPVQQPNLPDFLLHSILKTLLKPRMHLSLSTLAIIGLSSSVALAAPIPQMDDDRPLNPALRRLQLQDANVAVAGRPIPPALVGAPPMGAGQAQRGLFIGPPDHVQEQDSFPSSPARDQEPRRARQVTPPSPMEREVFPDVYPFTPRRPGSAVHAANPHLFPQPIQETIRDPSAIRERRVAHDGSFRGALSRLGNPNLMATHRDLPVAPLPETVDMRDAPIRHVDTVIGGQDQGPERDNLRTARAMERADAEEAARIARAADRAAREAEAIATTAAREAEEAVAHQSGNAIARFLRNLRP